MTARDIIFVTKRPAAPLLAEICEKHALHLSDIRSKCRGKHLIPARFEACYRLRAECHLSWGQIGRMLGGRDHSSAWHGAKMHALRNGLPELTVQS